MSYLVVTEGHKDTTLFLVDRRKTKKQWWTYSTCLAMKFNSRSEAQEQANKLIYKNPRVVSFQEAQKLENDNDYECSLNEEHPFSSEALGQWDD